MDNFEKAIGYVLMNEGGLVDDPDDPGGITNFGITLRTLSDYFSSGHNPQRAATPDDIKNLTLEQAKTIYRECWWEKMRLDEINHVGVATAILDIGVNSGPSRAIKTAQQAAGVRVDGVMGPKTIDAINSTTPGDFVDHCASLMRDFYRELADMRPSSKKFLAGWLARANRIETLA